MKPNVRVQSHASPVYLWLRIGFITALGLVSPPVASPQDIDLGESLARPLSPGSVGLLIEHARNEKALERLTAALEDQDPDVRAAAARVAFVSAATALVPLLETALAKETNRAAATEMIRALASYGGLGKAELLMSAAARFKLATRVGVSLAATHQHGALPYLDRLRALEPRFRLESFLQLATSGSGLSVLGPHTAKALRESDETYWRAYLQSARANKLQVNEGLLVFGVSAEHRVMRQETYWHVLLRLVSEAEIPTAVMEVLSNSIQERATAEDVGESWMLELIARQLGHQEQGSEDWIEARQDERPITNTALRASREPAVLSLLTKRERKALEKQFERVPNKYDSSWAFQEKPQYTSQGKPSATFRPPLRTVDMFPPGFVAALREITGCRPKEQEGGTVADVEFSVDGRPTRVTFLAARGAQEQCADASRVLILSRIRDPESRAPDSSVERLVVIHSPVFFSCLEKEPDRFFMGARRAGSAGIVPPKKIKDVNPIYPERARRDRVQGLIILEAIITSTGCVRSIRALRSVAGLDVAALLAVAQWRYEPTLLDGVPVPIVMTVTVNFELR